MGEFFRYFFGYVRIHTIRKNFIMICFLVLVFNQERSYKFLQLWICADLPMFCEKQAIIRT